MSRAARLLLYLAIIVPVIGITAVFVYVDASSDPASGYTVQASTEDAAIDAATPVSLTVAASDPAASSPATDENPLRPLGPKASDRVITPSSGSCSSGSCVTPTPARRSSCSSCD